MLEHANRPNNKNKSEENNVVFPGSCINMHVVISLASMPDLSWLGQTSMSDLRHF
jgi:hypothetical protein